MEGLILKTSNISITGISKLIKFFTSRKIEEIANKAEFTKRKTGLKAETFLKAFTVGIWGLHNITLDLIAEKCCELQYGLTMTKQGLFKRLKVGAVFLKELLAEALEYAVECSITTETVDILKQFNNVYVCDSTVLALPDKLEGEYQGLGSPSPKSSIKLQVILNVLQKRFQRIELWPSRGNDLSYNSTIVSNLREGDLVINDLGYFSIETFKEIVNKGAHFVSRLMPRTHIREEKGEEGKSEITNLYEILSKSKGLVDDYFYIGGKKKIRTKVRIVAKRLPEEVVNERRRREAKRARKKGRSMKKAESELLAWVIVVTDVPAEKLSTEAVLEIYRMRWQIEIVFKNWKSNFEIGKVGQAGKDYFECLLYGKLILITLMTTIYSRMYYNIYHENGRILSSLKFFKVLREKATELQKYIESVVFGTKRLTILLEEVIKRSITEKRKRKTTEQALAEYPMPAVVLQNVV